MKGCIKMKDKAFFSLFVGVLCFGFAIGINGQGNERKCRIKSMIGEVKIQRNKSPKWIAARPNMVLKQSDAIRTFVESEAVLEMNDGSKIDVSENTTLELSSLSRGPEGSKKTNMKILSGQLMANVKKLVHKKSEFKFETPTAVAAIRGTRVGFNVDRSKTNIEVYEGRVYVAPKGSKKGTELKTNEKTTVRKGQKTIVIEKITEKKEGESGTLKKDTLVQDTIPTKKDTVETKDTVVTKPIELSLRIISPQNGQVVIPNSQIIVAGFVKPHEAKVFVEGMKMKPGPKGGFRKSIRAKPEEGEYTITIEAEHDGKTKSVVRHYFVKDVPVDLKLQLFEPKDRQIIHKPIIKVAGVVIPPQAEVTISGLNVTVAPDGSFKKEIPIPDEEGEISLEVEATYKDKSVIESRVVIYKVIEEDIQLKIQQPTDRQIVCKQRLQIKGVVRPVSIEEIIVMGNSIRVRNGVFDDMIIIPEEPGEHEIEFEVQGKEKSRQERRIVLFNPTGKRCNTDIPTIQPNKLPIVYREARYPFTVFDKTPFDEIKVYKFTNGIKDIETGPPGSSFYLDVEPGIHMYEIYAEDMAENRSVVLRGKISRIADMPVIRMSEPASDYHRIHIPPPGPDDDFDPEFTLEFSVENLPDDNPKSLKEIVVQNKESGDVESLRNFTTDIDFEFDIKIVRGKNRILIRVRDIIDRDVFKNVVIEVR